MNHPEVFGLPLSTLDQLKRVFKNHAKVKKVLIYGSRATGTYRLGSDIDLCIQSPEISYEEYLKIENELEELLFPWKIDLILYHRIDNRELKNEIRDHGKPIYGKS